MTFPNEEMQQQIINEALSTNCSFRFMVVPADDKIVPLKQGDLLYRLGNDITIKDFLKLIHPAYLIPYLIYGRFGYELSLQVKAPWQEIIKLNYQVSLPMKLPGEDGYFWYTQNARVLTINENSQVISHINVYTPWRKFLEIADKYENVFIEATIFQDQAVYRKFQEVLRNNIREYYHNDVFKVQHWTIINAHRNNTLDQCGYEQTTIYSLNREITQLVEKHTGYKFPDITAIIVYLEDIGAV